MLVEFLIVDSPTGILPKREACVCTEWKGNERERT